MCAPKRPVATAKPAWRQSLDEELDQRLRDLAGRRALERRPPAAAKCGEQGELRDHQELAAHPCQVEVHLASGILEDPQTGNLARRLRDDRGVVAAGHANERQKAGADPRRPPGLRLRPPPA